MSRDSLVMRRATTDDAPTLIALVRDAGLAVPGLVDHLDAFLVAERDGRTVGTIGLELRGTDALLRSAVVASEERGSGIGGALFGALLDLARDEKVVTLYLLTTGAEQYWARHGFTRITRDDIPEAVKQSAEFAGACPASAAVMMRSVD
jgi:N-acetylglutamate synthase-like GNAT family acetyltransferase